MASSRYRRPEGKNAEEALIERISETFNLAPIFARTYLEAMRCLFAEDYQVPEQPGVYTVEVTAPGFSTWIREGVGVSAGRCGVVTTELQAELQAQG